MTTYLTLTKGFFYAVKTRQIFPFTTPAQAQVVKITLLLRKIDPWVKFTTLDVR